MKNFITNHKKGAIITLSIAGVCILALIILLIIRLATGAFPWEKKETKETTSVATSDDYDDIRNFKGLAVTIDKSNNWQSGNDYFAQFNVTIENHKAPEVTSWKMSIPTPTALEKDNSWNLNLDITNSALNMSNVDYNGTIPTDNTTSAGMILKSNSASNLDSIVGTYLIDKESGKGRLLNKEELKAFREGPKKSESKQEAVTPAKPAPQAESGTPFANHGALSVNGVDLVDASGNKYQLKGVSTHGLQWFPEYVNEGSFKNLRDDFGANVVRLAMYTDENGYCAGGDKAKLEQVIDDGVNAATSLGMYVIIDWHILHDNNPMQHESEAIEFFDKMSKKYANNDNVLYEICNEPNGGTNWDTIKDYADATIPVIRANDANAIVLVGTPTWSQDVDLVANNPLSYNNVMYTLHFYAGTHKDNIRSKLTKARDTGTPVFISEFSICDASGNGGIDYNSADTWKSLINDTNVSFVGWSLCNKNETSALLKPSCTSVDKFNDEDLSETGSYLKSFIRGE